MNFARIPSAEISYLPSGPCARTLESSSDAAVATKVLEATMLLGKWLQWHGRPRFAGEVKEEAEGSTFRGSGPYRQKLPWAGSTRMTGELVRLERDSGDKTGFAAGGTE